MAPAPLAVSLLLGTSALSSIIGLALDPDPFSAQSGLMISLGAGLLTVITISGVLLTRGRWSRWMTLVAAAIWFGSAMARPIDAAGLVAAGTTVACAAIAAGPWLRRWLRRLPASDAPPPAAVLLLLLLAATPVLIGYVAAGGEPGIVGWGLASWNVLLAFALARALTPAMWTGRFGHLPLAVAGGFLLGLPMGAVLAVKAGLETRLLWRSDVHLAVSPLLPPAATVPIPPELVDPAIMNAAGLDDRGRPLEE